MSDYFLISVSSSLQLSQAEQIMAKIILAGRQAELLPLTVAILDSGGQLVLFKREDGSGLLRANIAIGKAYGALGMGISSRTIRNRLQDRPAFQSAIATASDGKFIPVPGGVLILNEEKFAIGAVGISGDASDRDEYAAIAGIQKAGFQSHPETPDSDWNTAAL